MIDLEGEKSQAEVVEPTPVEGVEPTEPKVEPTVSITETPEFRQALDKALGKGLSSINSRLTLQGQEVKASKAEAEVAALEVSRLEKELSEFLQDDPEKQRAFTDRWEIAKIKASAEKKLYEAELKEWKLNMAVRARELMEETGIPLTDLEDSATQEEMEVRALRYKLTQATETATKEAEKVKTPKIDSGVNTGGGGGVFSRRALEEMPFREYEKIKPEVDKARREGRIKD